MMKHAIEKQAGWSRAKEIPWLTTGGDALREGVIYFVKACTALREHST
jgi:hypothetical protein